MPTLEMMMRLNPQSSHEDQNADPTIVLAARMDSIESVLAEIHAMLANRQPQKDWYTVREVAEVLERSEFTVREWCRLERVNASKRACGRGNSTEWIVSAEELKRIQNEGLLPLRKFA